MSMPSIFPSLLFLYHCSGIVIAIYHCYAAVPGVLALGFVCFNAAMALL